MCVNLIHQKRDVSAPIALGDTLGEVGTAACTRRKEATKARARPPHQSRAAVRLDSCGRRTCARTDLMRSTLPVTVSRAGARTQ